MKLKGDAPSESIQRITSDLNEASEEMMEAGWELQSMGGILVEKEIKADRAKALAFSKPEVNDKTKAKSQEMREILAAPHWEKEREEYLKAKYNRESQFEIVRAYRQRVSALQTIYNKQKMELEALNYGQDGGA